MTPIEGEDGLGRRLRQQIDDDAGRGEAAGERRACFSRRAPNTSPPTWATGSRLLIDSRTQRNLQNSQGAGRGLGIRARQAKPDRKSGRSGSTAIQHGAKPDGGERASDIAGALIERQGGKQAQPEKQADPAAVFSSDRT